jgi:hypothetical protein
VIEKAAGWPVTVDDGHPRRRGLHEHTEMTTQFHGRNGEPLLPVEGPDQGKHRLEVSELRCTHLHAAYPPKPESVIKRCLTVRDAGCRASPG